jgi:hypothetical protein
LTALAEKPVQFGDFQTPRELAAQIWQQVDASDVDVLIEPTVGLGAFLRTTPAPLRSTPWLAWDIQPHYVAESRCLARAENLTAAVELQDAFHIDRRIVEPAVSGKTVLVIGNPPWVTNSAQGTVMQPNLPSKWNRFGLKGIDAVTGKANFDIGEAVLLSVLAALSSAREIRVALLIKRSVAVKVAREFLGVPGTLSASFARIDAKKWFAASVEAGLFQITLSAESRATTTRLGLAAELGGPLVRSAGIRDGVFVEDVDGYQRFATVEARPGSGLVWRQGVKHDAAKVLELRASEAGLANGFGDAVVLEPDLLCPFYKSSDVANSRPPSRYFPLYQHDLTGPLPSLGARWPLLAEYLNRHRDRFAARGSSIYRGKPNFMLFGVGAYTLAPFKVAISGFYKSPTFALLCPDAQGHPPVVDDTCYVLPFESRAEAEAMANYLNSDSVQGFLHSIADQTAKRPYTKDVLGRIADPGTTPEELALRLPGFD